jgi:hypothetical protein
MKPCMLLAAVGLTLTSTLAAAQAQPAEPTKQQSKMAACNQAAGEMKGDERKAYMKDCLTNKQKAQQDKMKTCNAEAKDLKGDERKKFMSTCLKKAPA